MIPAIFTGSIWLLTACGGEQSADKKAQLYELKLKQEQLANQIATLEAEVQATDTAAAKVDSSKFKSVAVSVLAPSTYNHYVEIQGKVTTENNIVVSSETAGLIKDIKVKRGDKVKKGQVLAELDNVLIKKSMEELKSGLELATTVYEKQEKLWKDNVGTEIQYLQAKNSKENLELKMAQLQEQLKKTFIKAPIDGVVDDVFKKEGELQSPGMPAFRVLQSSDFKILGELAESYISKINVGDEVEVYYPDLKISTKEKISVVGSSINEVNRTFTVEVKVTKNTSMIKANLIAYLKINDFRQSNALVVPVNTVQSSRDGQYIYVADKGTVVKKTVSVKETYGNTALIASGLSAGDKIITFGYNDLTEGQRIKY